MKNLAGLMLSLFFLLSACGEGDGADLMPAVEGKRLDVAQSDLDKAGVAEDDVEIIGGGALGVIDESNWDVCDQQPKAGEERTGAVRLTVDRSCDGADSLTEKGAASSSPSPEVTTEAPAEEPETFKMPRLVGQNLQDAQDRLQSLGSYLLQQDDARAWSVFRCSTPTGRYAAKSQRLARQYRSTEW